MAKLPWYLKSFGKPIIEDGMYKQKIKIHWLYRLYIKFRYLLNLNFKK